MAALGRLTAEPSSEGIQKMLDENAQLIQAIVEKQNKGRSFDAMQYQQILYRNLLVLANLADPNMNIRDVLPKPNLYMQQSPAAPGYSMQSGMGVGQRPPMPSTSQGNPYPMGMPTGSSHSAALHRQAMGGQADPSAGHYPPPGASRPPPPQGSYQPALTSAVSQGHPPVMSPQQQEDAIKQQMAMQMQQHAQMMQQQQQGAVAAPRGLEHMGGAPSGSMPPPSYGQHRGPGQF